MTHAQKADFVFRQNGRVHLNRWGRQFGRLLAAEVCASAVVMLDTPCSEVVWRVLATYSIRQLPLHFPSCASPCAITFHLDSAVRWTARRTYFLGVVISVTVRLCIKECFVLSIEINVRNLLPNCDRFLLVHPVYQGWLQHGSHELLSDDTLNLPSKTLDNV